MPDDTPFKETLAISENDPTVDPFDAIEMIGVPGGTASPTAPPAPVRPQTPAGPTAPAQAPAPGTRPLICDVEGGE